MQDMEHIRLTHCGKIYQKVVLIFILLVLFDSCVIIKSQHLTYYKQLKTDPTQKLRLDGYYYHNEKLYDWDEERYVRGFFLYNDGTYKGTSSLIKKEDFIEYHYRDSQAAKDDVSGWGAYIIEGDFIKIQKFYIKSTGGFGGTWDVSEGKGKIVNDTTICYNWIGKDKEKYEVCYHFKHLIPKPDSTNWLATDKKLNRKLESQLKKK